MKMPKLKRKVQSAHDKAFKKHILHELKLLTRDVEEGRITQVVLERQSPFDRWMPNEKSIDISVTFYTWRE